MGKLFFVTEKTTSHISSSVTKTSFDVSLKISAGNSFSEYSVRGTGRHVGISVPENSYHVFGYEVRTKPCIYYV